MKTHFIKQRFSLLLLLPLLLSLLLLGCHKEEKPGNAYRLIETKIFEGGNLNSTAYYSYEGERLSEIKYYSSDFQDTARNVFEYPDENTIIWTDGTPNLRIECLYEDGKMTQFQRSQFTDNSWEILEKFIYQYAGGNLIEASMEATINSEFRPFEKFTYEYEGNKVKQLLDYYYDSYHSTWLQTQKLSAVYDGNLMIKIICYTYNDSTYVESRYTDLQYSGSLLTSASTYISSNNELLDTHTYVYDEHGNMISYESNHESNGSRAEYIYEEGKGNLQQIQFPDRELRFYLGFPYSSF